MHLVCPFHRAEAVVVRVEDIVLVTLRTETRCGGQHVTRTQDGSGTFCGVFGPFRPDE